MADKVQQAILAVEAEEQAVDGAGRLVFVVAREDGFHGMPDLEFAHRAFARAIGLIERFCYDPFELDLE